MLWLHGQSLYHWVVSRRTSGPHTVWLIWSILRVMELIKPARLWTKTTVRNSAASRCEIHTSTIQLTYIQYSTPHLRATLLCIFNGFVGYVWRTHPIIHIPAFINFTAEGPKNRVRESEIYSMKVIQIKGTSYAPSFPLASFPLLSYILSVSRERISKGQCAATVGTAVIDSDSMETAS